MIFRVIAILVLLAAACGEGSDEVSAESEETSSAEVTSEEEENNDETTTSVDSDLDATTIATTIGPDGDNDETVAASAVPEDCTGAEAGLPTNPTLSGVTKVDDKLLQVVEAAKVCDFDTLATLMADEFSASFGGDDGPTMWRQFEADDIGLMDDLIKVVSTEPSLDQDIIIWPSFFTDWECGDDVSDSLAADMALMDFDPVAGCSDEGFIGYAGYRFGIDGNDGSWLFFIAGD